MVGNAIPPEFYSAIEKGFREAANSGALIGAPVEGVRVVLTDGAAHAVDSNEMAFRIASINAFRQVSVREVNVGSCVLLADLSAHEYGVQVQCLRAHQVRGGSGRNTLWCTHWV